MDFEIRDAKDADADEVLDLAVLMWGDFGYDAAPGGWMDNFRQFFKDSVLNGPNRILVAEHPEGDGLIACGVGLMYQITPGFWIPNGKMGYLQWFSTRPEFRRQGIAEAIVQRFLDWYLENDVTRVQLHATETGNPLYRKMGFQDTLYPNLWWVAPGTEVFMD